MEKEKEEIQQHCLCDYGCGREAKHIMKNGKHCCEKQHSKCPAVKKKLSSSIKKNIQRWKEKGQSIKHHDIDPSKKSRNKHRIDNHGKCDNPGCTNYNDGSYGSGRFCSEHCAYAYAVNTTKDSKKRKAHYDKLHKMLKETKWKTNSWKCRFCNELFNSRRELKEHIDKDHYHIDISTSKKIYKCPFCGKEFDKPHSIGGHIANCKNSPNKIFHDEAHKRAGKTYSNNCKENPHLNGWLGKHHSKETREKISKKRIAAMQTEFFTNTKRKVKCYKVKNIKNEEIIVRGTWEVNVANHLNELGIYWTRAKPIKYINEITRRYIPDFYIPSLDSYIEVKGQYSDNDKEKMKLVQQQNPQIRIYFLIGNRYHDFIKGKIQLSDELLFKNYKEK